MHELNLSNKCTQFNRTRRRTTFGRRRDRSAGRPAALKRSGFFQPAADLTGSSRKAATQCLRRTKVMQTSWQEGKKHAAPSCSGGGGGGGRLCKCGQAAGLHLCTSDGDTIGTVSPADSRARPASDEREAGEPRARGQLFNCSSWTKRDEPPECRPAVLRGERNRLLACETTRRKSRI